MTRPTFSPLKSTAVKPRWILSLIQKMQEVKTGWISGQKTVLVEGLAHVSAIVDETPY